MDTNSSNSKKRNYRWLGVLVYLLIGAACGVLIMEYWDHAEEAGMPFIGQILSVVLLIAGMYAALVLQIGAGEGKRKITLKKTKHRGHWRTVSYVSAGPC